MDTLDFDRVKVEKANAVAYFNSYGRSRNLFQLFEFFVLVILISWSTTRLPSAVRFSAEFLYKLVNRLLNPHVVFVIGNLLIISLYVLSQRNDAEKGGGERNRGESSPPPAMDGLVPATSKECEAAAAAEVIERAAKRIERFRRTESERLKREISVKPLRRSETETRNTMVDERPRAISEFETVDRLSNDEFRLAVEAFISREQSLLKAQNLNFAQNDS